MGSRGISRTSFANSDGGSIHSTNVRYCGACSGGTIDSDTTEFSSNRTRSGEEFFCGKCCHSHKPKECPAFGKQCFKCKGKHHFKSMCKFKRRQVNTVSAGGRDDVVQNNSDTAPTLNFHLPFIVVPLAK